jgi:ABC-type lipoprotein export system ATPase subunit
MLLQIDQLRKQFRTPDGELLPVVDVPAFSLEAGQQVALRGASGTGKTTFLHLIAGILQADAGHVRIDTRHGVQDMAALPESRRDALRAETVGYIFQTFNLLQPFSALENVMLGMMFGRGVDQARATMLLQRTGLGDRLHYRPRQLSVGQQQRVAVARALANRPRLVLADEPTGNLDARHARDALQLIRDTCREEGAALLLVSHDEQVLAGFDTVIDLAMLNRAHSSPSATEARG